MSGPDPSDALPDLVGRPVPDVDVFLARDGAAVPQRTGALFAHGRSVLFGVPGAFTRGCSLVHLPGYVSRLDELRAAGFDRVVCTAVNDAYVLGAWSREQGADGILMLADGEAKLAEALGLTWRLPGLGLRSMRYATTIQDGVITSLDIDRAGGVDASSCENVLASRTSASASEPTNQPITP
jgi:peroxiredoxin